MLREVPIKEFDELKNKRGRNCALATMLEEFVKMNVPCVEVEDHGYSSVGSGVGSIRAAIQRWGYTSLECFSVDDKIYLCNNKIKVK